MNNTKKTLLIFFGEYRTFEYTIPQLENLDKVDIILSTWNISRRFVDSFVDYFYVDEYKIKHLLPNIKQYYVIDKNTIPNYEGKHTTWKMYWHWKNVINNIDNPEQYENVILHRCDMISDWHKLLDLEIQKDIVYLQKSNIDEISYIGNHSGIWINDYCFFGKFDIMKKFINSFDRDNYEVPHFPIYTTLIENNISFKHYTMTNYLVRDYHIEYMKYLNSNNINFLNLNMNSKLFKKYYEIINDFEETEKNRLNLENKK
jgi:hypothetical protein